MRVLAIDQGTSATKAFVLNEIGTLTPAGRIEHGQFHGADGRVEQNAEELARSVETLALEALTRDPEIGAVALANQGETVVAWDRRTKKPLGPAISWQDQRTQRELDALAADRKARVTAISGLPLDAYFSAAKLSWMLRHIPEAAEAARQGHLGLATSDAFLIDRLTGQYVTDFTTASRTSLLDLRARQWSPELCEIFGVPRELLPAIRTSVGVFGELSAPGRHVPLAASVVDQQAALFGHGYRQPGDAKITFGTGTFALAICHQENAWRGGGVPTIAWSLPDGTCVYAREAGDYTASAALDWAVRVGIARSHTDFELLPQPAPTEEGLMFVPALAGLAAPYWDRNATGLWIGLRQNTTAEEMRQAILEGIALRAAELIDVVCEGDDKPISADGGLSSNVALMRFFAEATGRAVRLSSEVDVTARGAAELGLLGMGENLPPGAGPERKIISPAALREAMRQRRARFAEAVQASRTLSKQALG